MRHTSYFRTTLYLCSVWAIFALSLGAFAVELSEYGDHGEFHGVFRGIVEGKGRIRGSKRPFPGWIMEDDSGQRFLYWVLEADASVAKVVAAPKSFIGRRCVIL